MFDGGIETSDFEQPCSARGAVLTRDTCARNICP
jgi:hypothetical protein